MFSTKTSRNPTWLCPTFFLLLSIFLPANEAVAVPFESGKWLIQAKSARIVEHLGLRCLEMQGGTAVLNGQSFGQGIIEFKIAFKPERGFAGIIWRASSQGNGEYFYLRPHNAGKPDATQYTPLFNGSSAWQLYHGAGFNQTAAFHFDRWNQVKLVIAQHSAEVYINSEQPSQFIPHLLRPEREGGIALQTSNFAPAYFADFRFTPMDQVTLTQEAAPPKPLAPGIVAHWQVAPPFPGKELDGVFQLNVAELEAMPWQQLQADERGIINLARLHAPTQNKNTVFTRFTLKAEKPEVLGMHFGFSDKVRVFFNGQLVYQGNDAYRSRDYRFLGSVGHFDSLYLPLKKGKNQVVFAVEEEFGGWGVTCRIDDLSSVTLTP